RTSTQVRSLLQMPCIAMVPLLKRPASTRLKLKQLATKPVCERAVARDASVFWRVVDSPMSPFAESIRAIRLATYLNGTHNKVIGFTSSLPDEGKSTIAAAVAQLTAQAARSRVIVVDCDLRNPTLSRKLAPNATVGIVDVIFGDRSLEETVWKDPATNLFFLPAVKKKPLFSSEVLETEQTKNLIARLRASFDLVIVDLPPLAPIVDVRAAAHLVDCMILVIEWGRTKINVVRHALDAVPNVHQTVIGAVLNKTNIDHLHQYDLHGNGVHKYRHYARYDYSDSNRRGYHRHQTGG